MTHQTARNRGPMRTRSCRTALFATCLALVGCAPQEVEYHLRGSTMGTTYNVKFVVLEDDALAHRAQDRTAIVLQEVNERFSTWIDDSLISRFNAHRSTEPFQVDDEFVRVLRTALQIAEWTDGAYDPTVLPLVRAYGFGPHSERKEPDPDQLAAARALVDWRKLQLLEGDRVRKLDPGVEIDLSSIAKGTGVDRVVAALTRLGLTNCMVEIGGEVVCRGEKTAGVPWHIGIEKPDAEAAGRPVQEVVELRDRAVATSGDYRNFFESGGHRVHHVIDPRTGHSTDNGVVQVSVLAPDCTLADGLATALMVVGPDAAAELLSREGMAGIEVRFLVRDADGAVVERRLP